MINKPQIPQRILTPFVPKSIKYYFLFKEQTNLGAFYNTHDHQLIPEGAIEISKEKVSEFLQGINHQDKLIYLNEEGQPQLRDRYTKLSKGKWVSDKGAIAEKDQKLLSMKAKQLLSDNDFRWNNSIRFNSYSKEAKQELTRFYNALLAVIRGDSSELPYLNMEIVKY